MNKLILYILVSLVFLCCQNNNKGDIQKRQIGQHLIEANFLDNNIIEGPARYYDQNNNLVALVNYKDGIKEGIAINYYLNGKVKDSIPYTNGLINGYSYSFDSTGNLLIRKYYYYGLEGGHFEEYVNGIIRSYSFIDFNKNEMLFCSFDSIQKVKEFNFSQKPILTDVTSALGDNALGLFMYFPKPPNLATIFKIGLIDDKNEIIRYENVLYSDRLYLDTVLKYPPKGWHYYTSINFINNDSSLNKVYIEDLKNIP